MGNREDVIILRVEEKERVIIREKMRQAGIQNMSAYIRKMALDGYCVNLDLGDIKELLRLLRICSNNLNQYAKKANGIGKIYQTDIKDLQTRLDKIWEQARKIVTLLSAIQIEKVQKTSAPIHIFHILAKAKRTYYNVCK